jgi:hypothetical protein
MEASCLRQLAAQSQIRLRKRKHLAKEDNKGKVDDDAGGVESEVLWEAVAGSLTVSIVITCEYLSCR